MTTKNLVLTGAVALVLVGAAVMTGRNGSRSQAPRLNGEKILPAFDSERVARIEVGDKLTLAADDSGWKLESMQGYPADRAKIAEHVLRLKELTVGQVARARKLGVETRVVLRDAAGEVVAEVRLGDKHKARGGYYDDGRYVAYKGETVLVKDALDAFDGDMRAWCETKIVDTPYVSFKELAAPDLGEETLGLATGVVAKVTIAGDTNRVATVGATVPGGTDRYLRLDGSDFVYVVPGYAVEGLLPKPPPEAPKAEERAAPPAEDEAKAPAAEQAAPAAETAETPAEAAAEATPEGAVLASEPIEVKAP